MAYTFDANADLQKLFDGSDFKVYKPGEIVTGVVVGISKKQILIDLEGNITGVIAGKEIHDIMGTAKTLELGQEVMAIVINDEAEDGMLLLSLRKAGQLRAWDKFQDAFESQSTVEIVPTSANKGGLLVDVAGIKAFLPVSQLSPENYPRVDDTSSGKILEKLQSLVGKKFRVRVIGIDKEEGKLIFSEREAFSDRRKEAIKDLQMGQMISGRVTGIVKFGIFVTFEELEGLIHISEIAWGHVKDPNQYAKVGDIVDVKVIGIDREKISLSLKQLEEDPWVKAVEKYKIGNTVKGTVNKVSDFGAFVTLDNEVNGLIHLSEIDHSLVNDPNDFFKVEEEIEAKVIDIDVNEHRIALSTKALKAQPEKKAAPKAEEKESAEEKKEEPKEVKSEETSEEKKEEKPKKTTKKKKEETSNEEEVKEEQKKPAKTTKKEEKEK